MSSISFYKSVVLLLTLVTVSTASTTTTPTTHTTAKPAALTATDTTNHCEVGYCMDCNSSQKCTLCKSNLLNELGECAGATGISNCLSFSSTECVACKPGHLAIFGQNGNITACNSNIIIEHCYNAEQKVGGKQVCVDCKTGYYLDGTTGTCQKIKNAVSHCFIYKSANSCKVCKPGYVTNILGTSDLNVDCNQKLAIEGDFAYCNTIKGGKCVSCDSHQERFAVAYDAVKGHIKCGKGGKGASKTKGSMRLMLSSGLVALALFVMAM